MQHSGFEKECPSCNATIPSSTCFSLKKQERNAPRQFLGIFHPLPSHFREASRKPAQPTTNVWDRPSEFGYAPTPKPILRPLPSMTQMPTPPPISDSHRDLRFRAVNYPTHEQEPGADPAPAMDDMPTIRGGGGEARGGGGHRADAGPELTRRAVGPRLYHKKSRMGCLRCKARRVKVSYLLCYAPLCYATRSSRVGCVTRADAGSLYMHVLSFVQRSC